MKKKDIKAFFKALRNFENDLVREMIVSDKEYLSVTNFAPPKKDDGQSALQVAFKISNFSIARLLIEQGADVNFIETSEVNEWNAPVLQDCIKAVAFGSILYNRFEEGFPLLQLMLEKGADPNAKDSYGTRCFGVAVGEAFRIADYPLFDEEKRDQLRLVFKVLLDAGADIALAYGSLEKFREKVKWMKLDRYNLFPPGIIDTDAELEPTLDLFAKAPFFAPWNIKKHTPLIIQDDKTLDWVNIRENGLYGNYMVLMNQAGEFFAFLNQNVSILMSPDKTHFCVWMRQRCDPKEKGCKIKLGLFAIADLLPKEFNKTVLLDLVRTGANCCIHAKPVAVHEMEFRPKIRIMNQRDIPHQFLMFPEICMVIDIPGSYPDQTDCNNTAIAILKPVYSQTHIWMQDWYNLDSNIHTRYEIIRATHNESGSIIGQCTKLQYFELDKTNKQVKRFFYPE